MLKSLSYLPLLVCGLLICSQAGADVDLFDEDACLMVDGSTNIHWRETTPGEGNCESIEFTSFGVFDPETRTRFFVGTSVSNDDCISNGNYTIQLSPDGKTAVSDDSWDVNTVFTRMGDQPCFTGVWDDGDETYIGHISVFAFPASAYPPCQMNILSDVDLPAGYTDHACDLLILENVEITGEGVKLAGGAGLGILGATNVKSGASLEINNIGVNICKDNDEPANNVSNWCVVKICEADPYCCNTRWDQICADETTSLCNHNCEEPLL